MNETPRTSEYSVERRDSELTCPYCHDFIRDSVLTKVCGACGAEHHDDCFMQFGGCSVFQCANSQSLPGDSQWAEIPEANAALMTTGALGLLVLGGVTVFLPVVLILALPAFLIGGFVLVQALLWSLPSLLRKLLQFFKHERKSKPL